MIKKNFKKVAAGIYDILFQFMKNFIQSDQLAAALSPGSENFTDKYKVLQEYMLLLILAMSHPAFTIEQKEQLKIISNYFHLISAPLFQQTQAYNLFSPRGTSGDLETILF